MKWLILLQVFALQTTFAAAKFPSVDKLMDNWKDAIYTEHEISKMRLTISPANEDAIVREATIQYKSDEKTDSKVLMRFNSPASIKGTAFLSLKKKQDDNSDQWIYFPAYKKARRLSSRKKDDSFLDSDFNNGDISFDYHKGYNFKVTKEGKIGDKPVYVLEGLAPAGSDTLYSKQVLYITKDTNLNLRSEYYNKQNVLFKVFNVEKWTRYGKRWAIDLGIMKNLTTKGQTKIEFLSRDTSANPPDKIFNLVYLERGQ